jgi:hypothetical protein
MVLKKNGRHRIFIYFTLLNKACPIDDYPFAKNQRVGRCNNKMRENVLVKLLL